MTMMMLASMMVLSLCATMMVVLLLLMDPSASCSTTHACTWLPPCTWLLQAHEHNTDSYRVSSLMQFPFLLSRTKAYSNEVSPVVSHANARS